MHRQAHYIIFGSVLLLALVLMNLPGRAASQMKIALGGMFLPLFGLAGSVHGIADRVSSELLPRRALLEDLERLRKENEDLRLRLAQETEIRRENQSLRQQVGWRQRMPWKCKLARVVARDPANWWRTVQIDLGSRDGVVTNLPVVTVEGLVGRIQSVGFDRSQVALIGDPNCRVSALVQETRDAGIINPGSSTIGDQQVAYLSYLPPSSVLTNGQSVVTSGLGGVFPPGIHIGKIIDTRSVGYGLYFEAQIKLWVNLNHLEEVWVILP